MDKKAAQSTHKSSLLLHFGQTNKSTTAPIPAKKKIPVSAQPTAIATESISDAISDNSTIISVGNSVVSNSSVISSMTAGTSSIHASFDIKPLAEESDNREHIKVCVRIRPLVRNEQDAKEILAFDWENNTIIQRGEKQLQQQQQQSALRKTSLLGMFSKQGSETNILQSPTSYSFDHLFYPEDTNSNIYDAVVQHVVNQAMIGFHGSVFAYGQTSSGKTFTMHGTKKYPGVIPMAIHDCFDSISQYPDREFLFRVSYLEVYNEQVHDLLNSEPTTIKIQYDPKAGTLLSGVKEMVVVTAQQVIAMVESGEAQRHVGSTDMNEKSSRAHSLFKIIIESHEKASGPGSPVRVSTLNLVDLAGSENAKMTNAKGARAIEAKHINQSLLTLSTIIQRLSEEKPGFTRRQHLPYRDSKLTRILQAPLSGNSQIAIICTISPALSCVEETNNTLKFAARAKRIKMDSKVNEVIDDKTQIRKYREEISYLRSKLREMESSSSTTGSTTATGTTGSGSGGTLMTSSQKEDYYNNNSNNTNESEEDFNQENLLALVADIERLLLSGGTALGNTTSNTSSTTTHHNTTTPATHKRDGSHPVATGNTSFFHRKKSKEVVHARRSSMDSPHPLPPPPSSHLPSEDYKLSQQRTTTTGNQPEQPGGPFNTEATRNGINNTPFSETSQLSPGMNLFHTSPQSEDAAAVNGQGRDRGKLQLEVEDDGSVDDSFEQDTSFFSSPRAPSLTHRITRAYSEDTTHHVPRTSSDTMSSSSTSTISRLPLPTTSTTSSKPVTSFETPPRTPHSLMADVTDILNNLKTQIAKSKTKTARKAEDALYHPPPSSFPVYSNPHSPNSNTSTTEQETDTILELQQQLQQLQLQNENLEDTLAKKNELLQELTKGIIDVSKIQNFLVTENNDMASQLEDCQRGLELSAVRILDLETLVESLQVENKELRGRAEVAEKGTS